MTSRKTTAKSNSILIAALSGAVLFSFSCRGPSQDAASLTCAASSTLSDSGQGLSLNGNSGGVAQSFVPQASIQQVGSAEIELETSGTFTGSESLILALEGDRNGAPDSTNVLATSSLGLAGNSGYTPRTGYFDFIWDHKVDLEAKTTYWLVLQPNFSNNVSRTIQWLASDQNPYPQGEAKIISGNVWVSPDFGKAQNQRDAYFKVGCL